MNKLNWKLGSVISLGISLVAAFPRLIRMDNIEIGIFTVSILYNFFFCFTNWIIYQYLFNNKRILPPSKNIFVVTALSISGIASFSFLYDYIFSAFNNIDLLFPDVTGSKKPYFLLLRGLLTSGLFYFICYYLSVLDEKQKHSIEIEQLKQAQLAANLSSLKEQLSPHFLFNTLNTLSALTQEKTVKDYVAELANVYRYVLEYKEMDTATIKKELSFIESYLYIIKIRLENSIEINLNVDDNFMITKIPPLTLQILIENAIKHNIASTARQLKIKIYSSPNGYLIISNNLQPKSSRDLSTGIGLNNLMQRYQLLFNKEIIIEKTENWFIVKLPIV